MPALSVGDCIGYAWNTFKQRPWFLIGAFALAMIISVIPSLLQTPPQIGPDGKVIPHSPGAYDVIIGLAGILVSIIVSLGMTTLALRAHDDIHSAKLADLWNPAPFWPYVGAAVITIVAIVLAYLVFAIPGVLLTGLIGPDINKTLLALGFFALLIPSFIVGLGLWCSGYLVIDRGYGPVQAAWESWRITSGNKLQLFLLGLVLFAIAVVGALALVVGIFVVIPIIMIAVAHAYRMLTMAANPSVIAD